MNACGYCLKRRAVQTDHFITKNQARRSVLAASNRERPDLKMRACRECNEAKGTRLRVPPSHAHLIPLLQSITGNVYATWDGSIEALREVVR